MHSPIQRVRLDQNNLLQEGKVDFPSMWGTFVGSLHSLFMDTVFSNSKGFGKNNL